VTANIVGAEVVVDGAVVGTTTAEADAFEVAPTAKQLEVRRDGYQPFSESLALRPGGAADVNAVLSRLAAAPVRSSAAKTEPPSLERRSPKAPDGFVFVPPGSFVMGSPDREEGRQEDEWRHLTEITRGFLIQSTEVTQRQYRDIMQTNPAGFGGCGDDCPVENVSWSDAVAYANALSLQEGFPACYLDGRLIGLACPGYRLPTEAEWEYAARAGASGASYTGLDAAAWYVGNANDQPSRVAQKQPNAGGIYDMLGNVWEWTGDWYTSIPNNSSDPTGAVAGNGKVARGGSWRSDPLRVRLAIRDIYTPDSKNTALGFRLVRTMP
jgi:formylglycine-generating enzyme required for sulfatase activity